MAVLESLKEYGIRFETGSQGEITHADYEHAPDRDPLGVGYTLMVTMRRDNPVTCDRCGQGVTSMYTKFPMVLTQRLLELGFSEHQDREERWRKEREQRETVNASR